MSRPPRNPLEWAAFIQDPDAHLGPADRGYIAAMLRQQEATIVDLRNRERSLRASYNQLERTLRENLDRFGETL